MIEDVVHIDRPEHGVDGHPDQAGAMNAEQRFDEFDRIVADGRNLLAGLEATPDQILAKRLASRSISVKVTRRSPSVTATRSGKRRAARFSRSPIATRPMRPGPGTPPVAARLSMPCSPLNRHCERSEAIHSD